MKFQIYLTLFSSLSLGIDKSSLSLLSFLRQLRISEPPPKFCLCEKEESVAKGRYQNKLHKAFKVRLRLFFEDFAEFMALFVGLEIKSFSDV